MEGIDVRKIELWRSALVPEPDLYSISARLSVIPDTAAAVIRYANSAYVGSARPVGTVLESVIRVGSRTIASFAMAGVSRDLMHAFGTEQMWSDALVVGRAAKLIGKLLGFSRVDSEHLFVAGLFSGAGSMGLTAKDEGYPTWRRKTQRRRTADLLTKERIVYGADHVQMAARLLEEWNLPTAIIAAVAAHHSPVTRFDQALWGAMTLAAEGRCLETAFPDAMSVLGIGDQVAFVESEATLFADVTANAYRTG
jgi:HD-like signal output (HDOD) protein